MPYDGNGNVAATCKSLLDLIWSHQDRLDDLRVVPHNEYDQPLWHPTSFSCEKIVVVTYAHFQ